MQTNEIKGKDRARIWSSAFNAKIDRARFIISTWKSYKSCVVFLFVLFWIIL